MLNTTKKLNQKQVSTNVSFWGKDEWYLKVFLTAQCIKSFRLRQCLLGTTKMGMESSQKKNLKRWCAEKKSEISWKSWKSTKLSITFNIPLLLLSDLYQVLKQQLINYLHSASDICFDIEFLSQVFSIQYSVWFVQNIAILWLWNNF